MAKLVSLVFGILFITANSFAQINSATVLKKWIMPSDWRIEKKRVGGLSACSMLDDKLYTVTDDRGSEGGPRIFIFNFDSAKSNIDFTKASVIQIKPDAKNKILDLEGISVISKDKIMLSSEGDLNQRPRVNPTLFWIDEKGQFTQTVQLPDSYLPEKSGQQTKGIQNNLGFEGLAIDTETKKWAAMLEGALVQDSAHLKLVESTLDSLKFDTIYDYPIPTPFSTDPNPPAGLTAFFGVSDILFLNPESFLILERGARFSKNGLIYPTQFCQATKEKNQQLSRRCFYSVNDDPAVKADLPDGANFEGLCWVNKQKKQFLTVSDNNFSKSEKTVFILYQLN